MRGHLLLHDLMRVLHLKHARLVLFAHPVRDEHRAEHAVTILVAHQRLVQHVVRLLNRLLRIVRVGIPFAFDCLVLLDCTI